MAKSDWEVVKDTSKKAAKVSPQAVKTVKSTPKIAAKPVAKVEVSKQNGKSKDQVISLQNVEIYTKIKVKSVRRIGANFLNAVLLCRVKFRFWIIWANYILTLFRFF